MGGGGTPGGWLWIPFCAPARPSDCESHPPTDLSGNWSRFQTSPKGSRKGRAAAWNRAGKAPWLGAQGPLDRSLSAPGVSASHQLCSGNFLGGAMIASPLL